VRKVTLRKHISIVHEKRLAFECDVCHRKFSDKYIMVRHCKVVHDKRKDFGCDVCQKKFGYKNHLMKHLETAHGNMNDDPGQQLSLEPKSELQEVGTATLSRMTRLNDTEQDHDDWQSSILQNDIDQIDIKENFILQEDVLESDILQKDD
jgi:hypothetical protein